MEPWGTPVIWPGSHNPVCSVFNKECEQRERSTWGSQLLEKMKEDVVVHCVKQAERSRRMKTEEFFSEGSLTWVRYLEIRLVQIKKAGQIHFKMLVFALKFEI